MTDTESRYIAILCSCPSQKMADELAQGLVESRLAACVQALPIRSTYLWKGKVEREHETLILIKTRAALYERVETWIAEHHSYEVPEIVRLPIQGGLAAYLSWIDETTAD